MKVPARRYGFRRVRARRTPIPAAIALSLQRVMYQQEMSGAALLIAAATALLLANLPWSDAFARVWETKLTIGTITHDLRHWINEGLMALFFFEVGLEIKREVLVGELSSFRRAALPLAGALGGMLAPMIFYLAVNGGQPTARGWGIVLATDIAFALAVLAVLGNRVPNSLRVFLLALAIVDDIGSIVVIATAYTERISTAALVPFLLALAALIALRFFRVRQAGPYLLAGLLLWVAVLASGVHATIAGVILAFLISPHPAVSHAGFLAAADARIKRMREAVEKNDIEQGEVVLGEIEELTEQTESLLEELQRAIHPWVAFVVLPLFALANAGIDLTGFAPSTFSQPLALGILLGLVAGKPLGIFAAVWLSTRIGIAAWPAGVTARQIIGVGALGGIGFTVSLFIADLAFAGHPEVAIAKFGVLIASLIAAVLGAAILMARSSR